MGIDKRDIKRNADRLLEKGLFDRAIREYLRIIDVEPEDLFALQKIAELHSRTGAEASAVSYYERAYKILNTRGFHEKSIGVLKRILQLDPSRTELQHALSTAQKNSGRLRDAANTLRTLIATYERRGERQQSLNCLKELVALLPEDWTNRIRLAEAQANLAQNQEACESFRIVLATLKEKANWSEFDRVSERVLYLYPDSADVARGLAASHLRKNKVLDALRWLQILFQSDPKNPETLSLLGDAFVAQGQSDKAETVYREAYREFEGSGRFAEAQEVAVTLRKLDPTFVATNHELRGATVPPVEAQIEQNYSSEVRDAAILFEFGLAEHAQKRLNNLPSDLAADEIDSVALNMLRPFCDQITNAHFVGLLKGFVPPAEVADDAPLSPSTVPNTVEQDDLVAPVMGLEPLDLDQLDFDEFEESSILTESVLDHIDTRELRDDSFDFELDASAIITDDKDDEFADLLASVNMSANQAPSEDHIQPPPKNALLETRENFKQVRPTRETPDVSSADETQEVSAIMDGFIEDGYNVETGDESVSNKKDRSKEEDVEDFGGLLDLDE